ncbi:helix-turn-helix domain-containing protein [Nordella sp. HKS 07]|uniref:helix-turn-helix domain-containing protein n=1 Tax=Nordella sp. HKS 07 TaxID=2712222 RepID=UPI0013E16BB9|nr:XRE family transcriptional regulator [Nordella sp. HKS 07]QIG48905.1 helix-turn-helix domain-containing protein [Nordella sp. HKS 07]
MSKQPKLGECLKALRRRNGWTLQDVNKRTGVAVSTLSKVENDQMSLTYDKLLQISEGLGINLAELLALPVDTGLALARRSVSKPDEGLLQTTPNYDYLYLCTEIQRKRMVPVIARVKSRDIGEFGPLVRHSGEEFIYVLDGAIDVHTDHYAPVRLEKGGSIYIDSTMGHGYVAVGPQDATVLAVCSSPDPDLEGTLRSLFAM